MRKAIQGLLENLKETVNSFARCLSLDNISMSVTHLDVRAKACIEVGGGAFEFRAFSLFLWKCNHFRKYSCVLLYEELFKINVSHLFLYFFDLFYGFIMKSISFHSVGKFNFRMAKTTEQKKIFLIISPT